ASAAVAFGCETADLGPVLDLLHGSKSRPAVVELSNAGCWRAAGVSPPSTGSDWVLAVGFEEKAATVEWQLGTLLGELKSAPVRDVAEVRGPAVASLWQALTDLQQRPESRLIWKASVPPTRVAEVVAALPADFL